MSSAEINITPDAKEDATTAILSYITIVGFIVAIVLHSNKKTALGAFHLRQVLGFIVIGIAAGIAISITAFILAFIPVIGPFMIMLLWPIMWIGGLAVWVMGLVAAIQGRQIPVPVIGAPIQKWFANAFN